MSLDGINQSAQRNPMRHNIILPRQKRSRRWKWFLALALVLALGFSAYELVIYAASSSKLIQKLEFEWTFDLLAISLSSISIIVVGVLSGLAPALKAERLQIIDALRSE